jgi:hypothetical protein
VAIKPLEESGFQSALALKMTEFKALYNTKIPPAVLKTIQTKYPGWLPVAYNKSDEPIYFTDFKLIGNFYMQFKNKAGKDISIVYFFQSMEKLKASTPNWAFINTQSGELIYDSLTPYKAFSEGYSNNPCLSPAGDKLDKIVLSGITASSGDAAGCCGPYDLENLTNGPQDLTGVELFTNKDASYYVVYSECGRALDPITGRYNHDFSKIDGPANIREAADQKSKLVGVCSDKSTVLNMGVQKKWVHVFCEGHLGWTSLSNIRTK